MQVSLSGEHALDLTSFHGFPLDGPGWGLDVNLAQSGRVDWTPFRHHIQDGLWEVSRRDSASGLESVTRFSRLDVGVWRRVDQLRNAGSEPLVVLSCLPVFCFGGGDYAMYSQDSRWSHENQGHWERLTHGERVLRCTHGRTTQGGTPFLALQMRDSRRMVAFHLEPRGNWMIRCRLGQAGGDTFPPLHVGCGLDDMSLAVRLAPGQSFVLPAVTTQEVQGDTIESSAPLLHRVLCAGMPACGEAGVPLVYNTWFDVFDKLDLTRLKTQVQAARAAGCDVFVVDAGWYGSGDGWACQGDWREKTDRAFCGGMASFADHVRDAGLGFGLWIEPEAIQPQAPVAQCHPDWFLASPGVARWPDLRQSDVRDWVGGEIARLIETYGVAWLKIDFNQPIGPDPERGALSGYYAAWYRLLDELRGRFPGTFFENCAGGGQRLEQTALRHSHGHFLSDTVHPIDTLRILQGALLRLPPGGLIHWAVLRSVGSCIPCYGQSLAETAERLVTPNGATWDRAETVDLDFAVSVAFPGILGFSGDLASLSPDQLARLGAWSGRWKQWRDWMRDAQAVLLTPVRPLHDRSGWVVIQLQRDDDHNLMLFVYRLDDPRERYTVHPERLAENRTYTVEPLPDGEHLELAGADLADAGLDVRLAEPRRGRVLLLRPGNV